MELAPKKNKDMPEARLLVENVKRVKEMCERDILENKRDDCEFIWHLKQRTKNGQ